MNETILQPGKTSLDYLVKRGLLEKAKKILAQIIVIMKNLTLYPKEHPQVRVSALELENLLATGILSTERQIVFNIFDEEIYFGEEPMLSESLRFGDFITACRERYIGSILINAGVSSRELIDFLTLLNADVALINNEGGIDQRMNTLNIAHIVVSSLKPKPKTAASDVSETIRRPTAVNFKLYKMAVKSLKEIFNQADSNKSIQIEQANRVINSMIDNIVREESTLLALTALKNHDEYTCYHSVNVAILSMFLGAKIGLERDQLFALGTGALLHDIGKVNIPQEIINKPGPLSAAEWQIMKRHPQESVEILCYLPSLDKTALIIAFEHHLGYNLSGYPEVNKIKRVHLFGRLAQIADAYDGATSPRSYHQARLPNQVLAAMFKKSGTAFDPVLIKIFIQTLGLYPVGSLVQLSTGDIGIVIAVNKDDISRPLVKIIADKNGKTVTPRLINLTEIDDNIKDYKTTIVKALDPVEFSVDLASHLKAGI